MYILSTATTFVAASLAMKVDAYNMYGGSARFSPTSAIGGRFSSSRGRCDPSSNFANSARAERYRQRQQRVDEAFRGLQKELNESFNGNQRRPGGNASLSPSSPSSSEIFMIGIPPGSYQEVEKEAVKKWVDKAFNLASEWNDDFAPSDQDREANKEFIEKSKDWIDRLYTVQEEVSEAATEQKKQGSDPETTEEWYKMAKEKDENKYPKDTFKSNLENPETPHSENLSNDEIFQVAVDLPGVERQDIDISFQGDYLTITAERRPNEVGQPGGRKFTKKFVLIEDEVEVDQINATLKNGILLVSAPKKTKVEKEEEPSRKIIIN